MIRLTFDQRLSNGTVRRREFLRFGALSSLGLGCGVRRVAADTGFTGFGTAKAVLLVYASGGQSQLETWDPKPDAPEEIRGEFGSIPTAVPGVRFGEHMPRLAKLADRFTVVRSVSHDDFDHGSATYLALTGRKHPRRSSNPPASPSDYPTYGALLQRVRPNRKFPYTAVHVNGPAQVPILVAPGQFGGILGPEFDPLVIGDPTVDAEPVPYLQPQEELPMPRLQGRKSLLESIDTFADAVGNQLHLRERDHQFEQAFEMLASPSCRQAFDLASESEELRDSYGRHRSGQACLLGRKLIEAGVPFVGVVWNHTNRGQDQDPTNTDLYGWDTHNDIFEALKVHLLPRFDQSFATLLEDMESRGLLDETLVICMGEFGRAPKVAFEPGFAGRTPGRKHWASAYSVVLAGAGVRRGSVFGATDSIAGFPETDLVGPWDLAATMFNSLGVDPEIEYHTPLGQPASLTLGKPIEGIFG